MIVEMVEEALTKNNIIMISISSIINTEILIAITTVIAIKIGETINHRTSKLILTIKWDGMMATNGMIKKILMEEVLVQIKQMVMS